MDGGVSMKTFSITDIGEKRKVNQDYVYCEALPVGKLENLFIVADGMGGHNAGDYASRFSVTKFVECVKESTKDSPIEVIETAIKQTNEALLKKSNQQIELEGMGTTFVVATIANRTLYVANIGDSRLYLVNKEITQITRDHSLVEEMVRTGKIQESEARCHPNKNVITRALGVKETVEPDCFEVACEKGDIVLMCSDGLTNMLEDDQIQTIVNTTQDNLEKTAKRLVEEANRNGGKDNIGIVLVKL